MFVSKYDIKSKYFSSFPHKAKLVMYRALFNLQRFLDFSRLVFSYGCQKCLVIYITDGILFSTNFFFIYLKIWLHHTILKNFNSFTFMNTNRVQIKFIDLWFLVRLEYKYSRLVMSANKDCELPAADSCALAEGEEPDDDVVYAQKPTLLGKLRAIANKV